MTITQEQYNTVINGLQVQLELQRQFNAELLHDVEGWKKEVCKSRLQRVSHLNAISNLVNSGGRNALSPDHPDYTPAYERVLLFIRKAKRSNKK